jgi:hypothetical protein
MSMLNGELPIEALELHLSVWRNKELPDYCFSEIAAKNTIHSTLNSNMTTDYEQLRYRKPFRAPDN